MTSPQEARNPVARWLVWSAPIVVAAVLVAAVFGTTLGGSLLADDFEAIWRASAFEEGFPLLGHGPQYWRPLFEMTLGWNESLGGLDPFGYRLTNLGLHVAVSAVLGACFVRLAPFLESRAAGAADWRGGFAAAALFAVMPSHTEAVLWVVGRADLLMTLAGLCCLLAFVAHLGAGRSRSARTLLLVASMLLLVLALLSKESAVVLAPVAFLLVAARELSADRATGPRRALASAAWASTPLIAVTAAWFVLRWSVLGSPTGGFETRTADWSPPVIAGRGAKLVLRAFVPALPVWGWMLVALGATGLAAVVVRSVHTGGGTLGAATFRTTLVFLGCVAICVLPVVTLGVSLSTVAGERLTYLPSAFAVLALARLWSSFWASAPKTAWIAASVTVVAAAALSATTAAHWRDASRAADSLVAALADLPVDQPAQVYGVPERDDRGVPVGLNAVAPALVLLHGWHDPGGVVQLEATPSQGTPVGTVAWVFDGKTLKRVG